MAQALITNPETFSEGVLRLLPYAPNEQQLQAVYALGRFCASETENSVFILNGYAGTGKTTLIGAFVRELELMRIKWLLLAPTGRAAKIFSANSDGHAAWTIHRKIYRHNMGTSGAGADHREFTVTRDNTFHNMLIIVDEASMIGNEGSSHGGGLLEDLITYVYSGDNCRMILVGDTAQLPPVGSKFSPAMNPDVLRNFGLKVSRVTLTETARQAADSGILLNATRLRRTMRECERYKEKSLDNSFLIPKLKVHGLDDVFIINDSEELTDRVERGFREEGLNQTIIITRSNRKTLEFNQGVRRIVLGREESISEGDILIVSKNHYFTGAKPKGIDFIANGDILRIEKIYDFETRYGICFADVALAFQDGETFDIKIIVDSLYSETAFLEPEKYTNFYYSLLNDTEMFTPDIPTDIRIRTIASNPYWNALYVKFAYAVTCHKAQGGQWDNVFIDLSYIPEEALGIELYRWLYTAVTRAKKSLYLISPPDILLE